MKRTLLVLTLLACGSKDKPIDDPQMQASAAALGTQNATMAQMAPDASEAEVQSNVQAAGGSLQALVGQHQAISQSSNPAGFARSAAQARQTTADEPVYYDGNELCIDITWNFGTGDIVYDVVLDYTTSGDAVVMDGYYNLDYDVGVSGFAYTYSVAATYNAVTIQDGCTVSGSVVIDYDVNTSGLAGVGGVNQSGRVVVDYAGCDAVTISGN